MQIEIKNIFKSYGTPGTPNYREVLSGIDLNVQQGECLAITGPSGSGKTTLLNLIGALDLPDSGEIRFGGNLINGLDPEGLDRYRNRSVGLVFQLHHLLPQLTLLENVLIPAIPLKDRLLHLESKQRAEDLLRRMGLWEIRNQKPGELSGGECQRTAVARALVNNPDLLLADEPTGALDRENAAILADLFLEINKRDKKTVILVTHTQELAKKMDKIFTLRNGRIEPETTSP